MRVIKHATLSFGAMFVPVGVCTAAKRSDVEFRTLHVDCGTPIKRSDRCGQCDMSLSSDDEVKGYEVAKGQFVAIDEDLLAAVTSPRSSMIELTKFVDSGEVSPNLIERSYYLKPNEALHMPYELLSLALAEESVVGVGKATLWGKEYPVAVESDRGILMLRYLFHADEVQSGNDIIQSLDFGVAPEHLEMLCQWVKLKKGGLEVDDLTNQSKVVTLEFIEKVSQGHTFTKPDPVTVDPATTDVGKALAAMVKNS